MLKQYLGNWGRGWRYSLLSFILTYITLMAVPWPSLTKQWQISAAVLGHKALLDKISAAAELEMVWIMQVSSSLTVVPAGYLCAASVSVLAVQMKEKSWRNQLSQWLPKIFTVLTNGDLLPCPPFRFWENKVITHMTLQVRLLYSPPSQ